MKGRGARRGEDRGSSLRVHAGTAQHGRFDPRSISSAVFRETRANPPVSWTSDIDGLNNWQRCQPATGYR